MAPSTADVWPVKRALISVSDKTGLTELGQKLAACGVEILSTGGSAKALADAGVPVTEVADYTGFPEMMDGRVKTLQPKIHGGILARRDDDGHLRSMADHDIGAIDLVVINLYPFEATVAGGADFDTAIENIDIGGPALIRAAAKNHAFVTVITDPAAYAALTAELDANDGGTTGDFRRAQAAAAFACTGTYDAAIGNWFAAEMDDAHPARLALPLVHQATLRYGENPHQTAAYYSDGTGRAGVATAEQLQGKALSFINLNAADAVFELAAEFDRPVVAIIKHANPCGVATSDSLADAWDRALACDPVSAFGGIIAMNRTLDAAAAAKMAEIFSEVIIAPDIDPDARDLLAAKKNLRVLATGAMPDPAAPGLNLRSIAGGLLLQGRDDTLTGGRNLDVVTKRLPTKGEMADMIFAFTVCKHVKSNAIVYAKDRATVGIGAGQMSRVDSARIAVRKGEDAAAAAGLDANPVEGSVVASDAFFPFADGLMAAAEAGATAVIQPGGSIRDEEVIAAADEAGLSMVFTGTRHFRH
jgi:phosphoribosylaminoimidazolecarboxamide formyltransferase/IMP cyclohydrolase